MKKFLPLGISILILLPTHFTLASKQAKGKKPNIILIFTDEHNFRTIGAHRKLLSKKQAEIWGEGTIVETPNIDRIANEGAICSSYYVSSPVCGPSRAAIISGLYPHNTDAEQLSWPLPADKQTFSCQKPCNFTNASKFYQSPLQSL